MVSLELEARLDNLLSTAQAETADVDIFAPILIREECPICMIPLPLNATEFSFMSCCGKAICDGCTFKKTETDVMKGASGSRDIKCAFCCQLTPKNESKAMKKLMKKNNISAFLLMASRYEKGKGVFQSDTKALEMRIRAAELGCAQAYATLAYHYSLGIVVEQDKSKSLEIYEIAAKKGSISAHKFLAGFHMKSGNISESIEHRKVVASAGDKQEMDKLMTYYKDNAVSKDELTQTLRAFQISNDLMKSKEREYVREIGM